MIKKYISSALIGLGISQMQFQPSQLIANEQDCEVPCCEDVLVGGEALNSKLINAGYPYPAIISPCNGWDIYAKGDFLYWSSVSNEQKCIAQRMSFDEGTIKNFYQPNHFRPGFRVAVGAEIGTMVLDLTYVRCHHHAHFPIPAGNNELIQLTGVSRLIGPPLGFSNVDIKLDLDFDLAIISLQQPVYLGKKIIMNLNYGVAVVWNDHKWDVTSSALTVLPPPTVVTANGFTFAHHKSWAVGPNLGFHVSAFLPFGFKAIAEFNLAAQYASVNKGGITQNSYPALIPLIPFVPSVIAYNTHIKNKERAPHIEALQSGEIGLGWGSYFFCDKFHLDLSLTYAFVFQGITVFGIPINGHAVDLTNLESYGMHGITVGGRVDF